MSDVAERIRPVLADTTVSVAYLFGSRARGDACSDSDADIAVLTDGRLALLDREMLADRLAQSLGVPEVDLAVLDEASLELRGHVVQEGSVVYSRDEPRRVAFETRTRSEWFDYRPTLEATPRALVAAAGQRGPVMVDPERLRRLLARLDGHCRLLAALRDLPADTYVAQQAFSGR